MPERRKDLKIRRERVSRVLDEKGRDVWSLPPEATVYQAIEMMAEKGVGALMVISGTELVGVISERDYARKVILRQRSSRDTLIKEVMTSPVVTVTSDQTVEDCMDAMTTHRIRHLPVIESDKLAGIVSIGDLVNSILQAQAETINHLHNYIRGRA